MLWAIAVLAGLQNGIVTNVGSVVFADYFGLEIAGSIQGVVQMIGMAGASTGPVVLAWALELTGLGILPILQAYALLFVGLAAFSVRYGGRPVLAQGRAAAQRRRQRNDAILQETPR